VISDGDRLEAQPCRLFGQLLRFAGAVEKAEVGMAVQLGIGNLPRRPLDKWGRWRGRLVVLTFARPRRTVATITVDRFVAGIACRLGPPRQLALEFTPWHVGVIEAHSKP